MNVIYKIVAGDRYYIGSSVNHPVRFSNHRQQLKRGIHRNKYLQGVYDKGYNLEYVIVEEVDGELKDLLAREQEYLDEHFDDINCMNLAPKADRPIPNNLKAAQEKGRQAWYDQQREFVMIKEGVEYGPYKTQVEAYTDLPISNVGVSKLWLGKQTKYKGFSLKFI